MTHKNTPTIWLNNKEHFIEYTFNKEGDLTEIHLTPTSKHPDEIELLQTYDLKTY